MQLVLYQNSQSSPDVSLSQSSTPNPHISLLSLFFFLSRALNFDVVLNVVSLPPPPFLKEKGEIHSVWDFLCKQSKIKPSISESFALQWFYFFFKDKLLTCN